MKQKIALYITLTLFAFGCKKQLKQNLQGENKQEMKISNNANAKIVQGRDLSSYLTYSGNTEMTTLNKNVYVAHESPVVAMPTVNSGKTYSGYLPFYSFNDTTHYANHILRRY